MEKNINAIVTTDVLGIIFCHVAIPRKSTACPPSYRKSTNTMKDVLTISHVCRLWRYTALSLSSLWAFVNIGNNDPLAECFIDRSCAHPLWLDLAELKSMDDWYTRSRSLVSDLRHRIASLWIPGDPFPSEMEERSTLSLELPALKSLVLYNRGQAKSNAASMFSLTLTAPNLRALAVTAYKSSLLRQQFPHLVHLQLSHLWFISMIEVMPFLQATPLLESLVISRDCDQVFSTVHSLPPPVPAPLPRLRSILFNGVEAPQALWALAGMTLPEDRKVRVVNCTSLLQDYSAAYPLPHFNSIRDLQIVYYPDSLYLYATGGDSGIWVDTDDFANYQEVNGLQRIPIILSLLLDALSHSPITAIHLRVYNADGGAADTRRLFQFICSAPSLRTLTVSAMDDAQLDQLFDMMGMPDACPSLTDLVVDTSSLGTDAPYMVSLRNMAAARADAGHPLRSVVFKTTVQEPDQLTVSRQEQVTGQLERCGVASVELAISAGPDDARPRSNNTVPFDAGFWSFDHEFWELDEYDRPQPPSY